MEVLGCTEELLAAMAALGYTTEPLVEKAAAGPGRTAARVGAEERHFLRFEGLWGRFSEQFRSLPGYMACHSGHLTL